MTEAVQARNVPVVVGSIVIVSVLTRCALFQSVCHLKAAQMNIQFSLNREITQYQFELDHNIVETTKKK